MPSGSDENSGLSEAAIARIAGVERSRRRAWAEAGLMRLRGRAAYGELDACEATVFRRLVAELDFERAREAWLKVRPRLHECLLAERLLIVYAEARAEGHLASAANELAAIVSAGGRFTVIDVSAEVAAARLGFRNALRARDSSGRTPAVRANVQTLHQ